MSLINKTSKIALAMFIAITFTIPTAYASKYFHLNVDVVTPSNASVSLNSDTNVNARWANMPESIANGSHDVYSLKRHKQQAPTMVKRKNSRTIVMNLFLDIQYDNQATLRTCKIYAANRRVRLHHFNEKTKYKVSYNTDCEDIITLERTNKDNDRATIHNPIRLVVK